MIGQAPHFAGGLRYHPNGRWGKATDSAPILSFYLSLAATLFFIIIYVALKLGSRVAALGCCKPNP